MILSPLNCSMTMTPEAKGRIERLRGTFHDRLLNQLHLDRVDNIQAANEYLQTFLPAYNLRFAVRLPNRAQLIASRMRDLYAIRCFASNTGKPSRRKIHSTLIKLKLNYVTNRRLTIHGEKSLRYTTIGGDKITEQLR